MSAGWIFVHNAPMAAAIQVTEAQPADMSEVRAMLREYAEWLAVDLSFQDFAREVANLPGDYAPPTGALFVARDRDQVVGVVAFRARERNIAEMKRLFVRPAGRGSGVGRMLVERIIAAAEAAGCTQMVLDTLPVMSSAQRLYEQLGFEDIPPYYVSPIAGTRYMGLTIQGNKERRTKNNARIEGREQRPRTQDRD
jgi:GNAT superfamily N-acetyltransferase